ncbi:hypothetical protein, partial [Zoogloea sp.]|uniref:hypothetical protein n=1 Tax=Zoogloea sp. TaxID=49181 RepID=UPI00260F37DE
AAGVSSKIFSKKDLDGRALYRNPPAFSNARHLPGEHPVPIRQRLPALEEENTKVDKGDC